MSSVPELSEIWSSLADRYEREGRHLEASLARFDAAKWRCQLAHGCLPYGSRAHRERIGPARTAVLERLDALKAGGS